MFDYLTRCKIAIIIFEVAMDTAKRQIEKDGDDALFLLKDSETFESIRDEFLSKLEAYTQKTLKEIEEFKKMEKIINPLTYSGEKVTQLAVIQNEGELKLKHCDTRTADEIFTIQACCSRIWQSYLECANKIIEECEAFITLELGQKLIFSHDKEKDKIKYI